MKARDPGLTCHLYATAEVTCTCGTLGKRLPDSMPDTGCPAERIVDRSSESLRFAETEKSRCSLGLAVTSSSTPWLRAFGTLKISRDEHVPAVTLNWRSWMSM